MDEPDYGISLEYSTMTGKDYLTHSVRHLSRVYMNKLQGQQVIWNKAPDQWPNDLGPWKNPTSSPKDSVELLEKKYQFMKDAIPPDKLSSSFKQRSKWFESKNLTAISESFYLQNLSKSLKSYMSSNIKVEEAANQEGLQQLSADLINAWHHTQSLLKAKSSDRKRKNDTCPPMNSGGKKLIVSGLTSTSMGNKTIIPVLISNTPISTPAISSYTMVPNSASQTKSATNLGQKDQPCSAECPLPVTENSAVDGQKGEIQVLNCLPPQYYKTTQPETSYGNHSNQALCNSNNVPQCLLSEFLTSALGNSEDHTQSTGQLNLDNINDLYLKQNVLEKVMEQDHKSDKCMTVTALCSSPQEALSVDSDSGVEDDINEGHRNLNSESSNSGETLLNDVDWETFGDPENFNLINFLDSGNEDETCPEKFQEHCSMATGKC